MRGVIRIVRQICVYNLGSPSIFEKRNKRPFFYLGFATFIVINLVGFRATATTDVDVNFDRAVNRCNLLGYVEKTDPWRACVLEQLRVIGGELLVPKDGGSETNVTGDSSEPSVVSSQGQSSVLHGRGNEPESVSPGPNETPSARSHATQYPPISRQEAIVLPKLKRPLTANENRACFAGYVGAPVALTYEIEVGTNGKAILADWPEAYPKTAQKAVQCALSKQVYEPATQNGMPVVARVRQGITIGRAHRPSELPKIELPKFVGFNLNEANRCYPFGFQPSGEVEVEVEVVVSKRGSVAESRATSENVPLAVREIAECLAKTSQFEPGTIKGKATAMTVNFRVAVKT